jgi:hypothetical protein
MERQRREQAMIHIQQRNEEAMTNRATNNRAALKAGEHSSISAIGIHGVTSEMVSAEWVVNTELNVSVVYLTIGKANFYFKPLEAVDQIEAMVQVANAIGRAADELRSNGPNVH